MWVPQGSISGPLLINIFLDDVLVIINETDIASYVDCNIPYAVANNLDGVIKSREKDSDELFKWISDNQVEAMNG